MTLLRKMIIQILCVVLGLFYIWQLWRKDNVKRSSSAPLLSGHLPILGHALRFVGDRKYLFNQIKSISKESLEKGGVITIKFGAREVCVISDPDDCAKVSNECLEKFYFYDFYKPLLGNGLTTADIPLWKAHRKYLNPMFRQTILNEYLVVFNIHGRRLVKQFEPKIGKGPFDHEFFIKLNSLESICTTAFNSDYADFDGLHKQYLEGITGTLDIITERMQSFWLHSDLVYKWSNLKKKQDVFIKNIKKFITSILQNINTDINQNRTVYKQGSFTPFINLLINSSKETNFYSEEDIVYETNTLITGGFDTTSIAITLVLVLLGSHPEVQKKTYEELEDVLTKENSDLVKEDLPKLNYLDAVIKETLRLYPVGPTIGRHAVKDVQLKNYTIKAGTGISLLFWAMHRHPIWGTDAEVFRPERWLDGSLPKNPNAFGAFSLGRRSCIGKTYAMMFMKTILAHVIKSYQINSDISKLQFEITTTLKPSSGYHISIEKRT